MGRRGYSPPLGLFLPRRRGARKSQGRADLAYLLLPWSRRYENQGRAPPSPRNDALRCLLQ